MNQNVRTLTAFKSSLESLLVLGKSLLAHDLVTSENLIAFQTLSEHVHEASGLRPMDEETVSLEDSSSDLELQLLRIQAHVQQTDTALEICDKSPDPEEKPCIDPTSDVVSLESLVVFNGRLREMTELADTLDDPNVERRVNYLRARLREAMPKVPLANKWLDDACTIDECRSIIKFFSEKSSDSADSAADRITVSTESIASLFDSVTSEFRRMLTKPQVIDLTTSGTVAIEQLNRTFLNPEWREQHTLETDKIGVGAFTRYFFTEVGFTKNIYEQARYNLRQLETFTEAYHEARQEFVKDAQVILDKMREMGPTREAIDYALPLIKEVRLKLNNFPFDTSLMSNMGASTLGARPSTMVPLTWDEIIQYGRLVARLISFATLVEPDQIEKDRAIAVHMSDRDDHTFWGPLYDQYQADELEEVELLYTLFCINDTESMGGLGYTHARAIECAMGTATGLTLYMTQSVQ